jgi:hypothetical protein
MTTDEVKELYTKASDLHKSLDEFLPLLKKKHEKWTVKAYEDTLLELREVEQTVFTRLFKLEEALEKGDGRKLKLVENGDA